MKHSTMVITGCDSNTEWQLPWFLHNYMQHNSTPITVADFGMSDDMLLHLEAIDVTVLYDAAPESTSKGWFKKPRAVYRATEFADVVCWLDTDCQVTGDISGILSHYKAGRLGMVQDRPWTKLRPGNGTWYNSGVIVSDRNYYLREWYVKCEHSPIAGDQEVLHNMYNEIQKLSIIEPLPHKYNTLRLDYIHGINTNNPLIIHHTGFKGNDTIRGMMQ